MDNNKGIIKSSGRNVACIKAIEIMVKDMNLTQEQVANMVGVSARTLTNWIGNPRFVDALYNRYMEVSGIHLPEVVQAMIQEAKLGNVHAARLVLEHFGKLENKIKIQVESNFEKFMKSDDTEDAEWFDVTNEQEDVFDAISDHIGTSNLEVPEKHPSNNSPKIRDEYEKYRVNKKIKKTRKDEEVSRKQAERHIIRKRAKEVDLELLAPGRHTKSERDDWMQKLIKLEQKKR
tara:strand:+ start:1704 stop:2402 length:699 start_codon:yes stop_codon:yes gene_type:complete